MYHICWLQTLKFASCDHLSLVLNGMVTFLFDSFYLFRGYFNLIGRHITYSLHMSYSSTGTLDYFKMSIMNELSQIITKINQKMSYHLEKGIYIYEVLMVAKTANECFAKKKEDKIYD